MAGDDAPELYTESPQVFNEEQYPQPVQPDKSQREQNWVYEKPTEAHAGDKKILGLSVTAFVLLLLSVTVLVVGGAVGGGLGGALASCRSKKCSDSNAATQPGDSTASISIITATVTVAPSATANLVSVDFNNYTSPSPTEVNLIYANCPAINASTILTRLNQQFTVLCNINVNYGNPSVEDSSKSVDTVAGLIAYSLEDCVNACSAYNYFANRNGAATQCHAITINLNLSEDLGVGGDINCWLKNGTTSPADWTNNAEHVISAQIAS